MVMSSNITINSVNPDLTILGATQRFVFDSTDPLVRAEVFGQFVPIIGTNSVINFELRNSDLAGFRLKQTSATTDTFDFGKLELQYYVNDADTTGTTVWQYSPGTTTGAHTFYSGSPPSSNALILTLNNTAAIFTKPIYGRSVSGLMYFSGNATATTTMVTNTWLKVSGTTTLAATGSEITMPANNRLTFTTSDPSNPSPTIVITANFIFKNAGAASAGTTSFGIYKNGTTLIAPSSTTTIAASSTNWNSVSLRIMTAATSTDYFELWAMNSVTNTPGILVQDGSISIESV
jgi:hypothetical protein